jgi:hypothetical protein
MFQIKYQKWLKQKGTLLTYVTSDDKNSKKAVAGQSLDYFFLLKFGKVINTMRNIFSIQNHHCFFDIDYYDSNI